MAHQSKRGKVNVFMVEGLFIKGNTLFIEYKGSEWGQKVAKVSLVRPDPIEEGKTLIVCRPFSADDEEILAPYRCLQ